MLLGKHASGNDRSVARGDWRGTGGTLLANFLSSTHRLFSRVKQVHSVTNSRFAEPLYNPLPNRVQTLLSVAEKNDGQRQDI